MAIDGISGAQVSSLLIGVLNSQLLTKAVSGIQGPNGALGQVEELKSNLIDSAARVAQAALDSNSTIDIKA
ncbi:MAG: hypothetical protein HZA50_04535 [Planctomycetes bacterium]|nr:hypothetical protein [Planctomycetota bacterium]